MQQKGLLVLIILSCATGTDAYPLRPAMPVDGILGIGVSQCRGHVPGAKPDPASGFHGPDLAELGMFCYD